MSDRTPVQLIVAACPDDQIAAVLELIEEFGLGSEYEQDAPEGNELVLGQTYMYPEVPCGSAGEIARRLQEVAPGASWEVWEDPRYEWLGDIYRFTPELGVFTAESDAEGNPVFTCEEILAKFGQVDEHELRLWLGLVHRDALNALNGVGE